MSRSDWSASKKIKFLLQSFFFVLSPSASAAHVATVEAAAAEALLNLIISDERAESWPREGERR